MIGHIWRYPLAVLAAIVLVVSGGSALGAPAAPPSGPAPAVPVTAPAPPVDCATLPVDMLRQMTNAYAFELLARCGYADRVAPPSGGGTASGPPHAPLVYGGVDRDVILPDGTAPHLTQSETFVWANATTIVANYNDSRTAPSCYSGIAWSTDGGTTWHPSQALCTSAHGTNEGDPMVVYNARLATWYAGDLAVGGDCGSGSTGGIGLWTSPNGQTWSVGGCAHVGTADDRQSMWVDNNPASPFYGRMYVSWNNFAVSGGRLFVTFSDNGTTWSAPVAIGPVSPFVRNGQVTGSENGDGTVFVSGHTEGTTDTTYMFRSTNGGVTWTQITVNVYTPAGSTTVPGCSFRAIAPIWRAPEWGQPAVSGQLAGQNVVHYVYAAQGTGGDLGDTMYVRSTDNGATWGTPVRLNTDATTQPQWQPSISAAPGGGIFAAWYDRRATSNGTNYEYYGRLSTDNGATWQPDMPVSDVLITQPVQPDPNVQACYAGDYNYHSAFGNVAYLTWADGRTLASALNTQDVEFDKVSIAVGTPTPTVTGTPPTNTPTVTRTATATATATPCSLLTALNEGFESGTLATFSGSGTGSTWAASSAQRHSGTWAAAAQDPATLSDQRLTLTSPIAIPAGGGGTLSFWHTFSFDTPQYDGGVLEFSTDAGATWIDAGPYFLSGGYTGTLNGLESNPLGVRAAWTDNIGAYPTFGQVTVNLAAFAGQNLLFRFRLGSGSTTAGSPWYVDDVLVTTSAPCATVTPTATATPCPRLVQGHVTYQGLGQPNAANVQGVTLQLKSTGGGAVTTFTTSTDANGLFSVNVSALAPGAYNWWLKSPRYLANGGTITLTTACSLSFDLGTLRAGDINNDNCVDVVDFTLLRATFGKACADPGYDARADYNGDCLVDISDFTLLRGNFGQCGAPALVGPDDDRAP
jgi:hypothetical protein